MKHILISFIFLLFSSFNACAQDVHVFAGHQQSIDWMESIGWWGEDLRAEQMQVPRPLLIAISPAWRDAAAQMAVATKKEFFYRCLLPLVTHANWLVRQRRAWLMERKAGLESGRALEAQHLENMRLFATTLRVRSSDEAERISESTEWLSIIDELLYRLDEIPAGLALGQAAYESGWGTSRFTDEGNALFGQWTYGGEGMAP